MTESDTQAAVDPAEPVTSPPINYKPDSRADVDRKKSATTPQRPRKFPDGKRIWKKNEHDIMEYEVNVVSARYDEQSHSWMYVLTDWENKAMSGETEETRLG